MERGHSLAGKLCVGGSGQKHERVQEKSENDGYADGVGMRSARKGIE